MLDADNEVRIPLHGDNNGEAPSYNRRWITDLDVQTIKRAEGLHGATDEEKGPWVDENGQQIDLESLMMLPPAIQV